MDARTNRRQKRISKRQETRVAAAVGGRTQAGSGAAPSSGGGDVRVLGHTRIECKYTEKDYYTLKLADLKKLKTQATRALEQPVFQIHFVVAKTSLCYEIAILQATAGDREVINFITHSEGKSIRLRRDILEVALFRFQRRALLHWTADDSWYVIVPWSDFLERNNSA